MVSKSVAATGTALTLAFALLAPAAYAVDEAAKYPKTDGDGPVQNLTLADDGDFYGITPYGGEYGYGVLFQFDPRGNGEPTILHSFSGRNGDGKNPSSPPLEDENGNFYGVTQYGGASDAGVIYILTADGRYIPLYSFSADKGKWPMFALAEYAPGQFAGTEYTGSKDGGGSLFTFQVDATSGPIPTLVGAPSFFSFGEAIGGGRPNGLLLGPGNLLCGTTVLGGTSGNGTVFAFNPATRALHVLHNFSGGGDGANPLGSLLYANGLFYGTTDNGGIADGTIYTVDLAGNHQTLYRFHSYNYGLIPQSAPVMTATGDLLITLGYDGRASQGVVFDFTGSHGEPNLSGPFGTPGFGGYDGSKPLSGLVAGNDGLFYGMTEAGGYHGGHGTIYALDPISQFHNATLQHTLRHSFGNDLPSVANRAQPYFDAPTAIPGIVALENYDLGGEGVSYHSIYDNDPGNDYRPLEGVAVEAFGTGGLDDIGYIVPGEWQNYTVAVAKAGRYKISFVVNGYGGTFHLENQTGENLTGPVNAPNVGTYRGSYTTVDAYATLPAGVQTLKLYDDTGGYNYVSMTFTAG